MSGHRGYRVRQSTTIDYGETDFREEFQHQLHRHVDAGLIVTETGEKRDFSSQPKGFKLELFHVLNIFYRKTSWLAKQPE